MKRLLLTGALALLWGGWIWSLDVKTQTTATLEVTARTTLGTNLSDLYATGLKSELRKLTLSLGLVPYQHLETATPKAPAGQDGPPPYAYLSVDGLALTYKLSNGRDVADEAGAKGTYKPGWNDINAAYLAPTGLYNFTAGILFGDWYLAAYSGGNDYAFPWNRNLAMNRDALVHSWAYLDSRVQYATSDYWALDTTTPGNYDGLWASSPATQSGQLLLGYTGSEVSANFKVGSEFDWTATDLGVRDLNGWGLGTDVSYKPEAVPGLSVLGSTSVLTNYGTDSAGPRLRGGSRVGYDIPWVAGLSWEPYLGLDGDWNPKAPNPTAWEASAGATLHWPGITGWGWDLLADKGGNVFTGLTVAGKLYHPADSSLELAKSVLVTLYNERGAAKGPLKNLGAELVAELFNLGSTTKSDAYNLAVYLDYTLPVGPATPARWLPWARGIFTNAWVTAKNERVAALAVQTGLILRDAVPGSDFGITYKQPDALKAASFVWGTLETYVEVKF